MEEKKESRRTKICMSTITPDDFYNACYQGYIEIVRTYYDITIPDLNYGVALMNACCGGHIPIVKLLLSGNKADIFSHISECLYSIYRHFSPHPISVQDELSDLLLNNQSLSIATISKSFFKSCKLVYAPAVHIKIRELLISHPRLEKNMGIVFSILDQLSYYFPNFDSLITTLFDDKDTNHTTYQIASVLKNEIILHKETLEKRLTASFYDAIELDCSDEERKQLAINNTNNFIAKSLQKLSVVLFTLGSPVKMCYFFAQMEPCPAGAYPDIWREIGHTLYEIETLGMKII